MQDRVVVEPPQVAGRHISGVLTAVGVAAEYLVEPPDLERVVPSTMREDEVQLGVMVHHAPSQQAADGDGGVVRVLADYRQVELRSAREGNRLGGVDEDGRFQFSSRFPKWVEIRAVQVAPIYVGSDHAPDGTALLHPVLQLLGRQLSIL